MSPAELADDTECKEIAEETKDKCEEDFGKVVHIIIARPGREGLAEEHGGVCFVRFQDEEGAKKAATGLWHLKFDDRVVETDFLGVENFEALAALYPEQTQPAQA
uniref:RRM domain-containing protein n=1 Tax=Hemiselmis andersenii TaxID=464988 RepID=A0A7S1DRX3_HEMAN|mmetsp:Transcript_23504/g.57054  ORF Transcript_23504/g.57054 Transcript_23504/m.57054 type:complete len:105 (+) Transcript_23504:2-316(+)